MASGFGVCGSFLETSGEKELSMAKVNVLAMHQLFKFAVKKMEAQGFGTVLNVASSAGLLPGAAVGAQTPKAPGGGKRGLRAPAAKGLWTSPETKKS